MGRLTDLLEREQQLARLRRELATARADNDKLRLQIDRLRTAMRHCTTCEYHPRNRSDGRAHEAGPTPAARSIPGIRSQ